MCWIILEVVSYLFSECLFYIRAYVISSSMKSVFTNVLIENACVSYIGVLHPISIQAMAQNFIYSLKKAISIKLI